MNVDPGAPHNRQTIGNAWQATLHARFHDRIYLALTAAAFVLGIVDSALSKTLATVPMMCLIHAAGTAAGLAGRHAHKLAPHHGWQPQWLLGRLLGVLTLSVAFTASLLAATMMVTDTGESITGFAITAFSGVAWIVSLVFFFSTFLPRRLDSVIAVLLFPISAALYKSRTQFTNTTAARAIETLWENAGALVISDAAPGTAAWTDLAQWAANITVAVAAGLLVAWWRHGRRADQPHSRRSLRVVMTTGLVAIAAVVLVPRVDDQVSWVTPAASSSGVDTSEAGARPTLYNFTADWCVICARLERDLFAEAGDARWISERFVPVRVLDRKREDGQNDETVAELRERFKVTGFPTLVVVAPDGRVLTRVVGYSGNLTEVRQALSQSVAGAASLTR